MLNKILQSSTKIWIFQCDPKKYRIFEALKNIEVRKEFHWRVNQYKKEIAKGHIGLIWCSGMNSGICAIAVLISDPIDFVESDVENSFWIKGENEEGNRLRVKMKILKSFDPPYSKDKILNQNGLQNLSIIKRPWGGTNFPITNDEWTILNKLL